MTAGRGGAVVTNREDVLQRIKIYCERGNDAFPLSELQAAVLVPQLVELPANNRARLMAVQSLLNQCADLPGLRPLQLPVDTTQDCPAFYKLAWRYEPLSDTKPVSEIEPRRDVLIAALQAEGVAMDAGFRGFVRRTGPRCRTVGELDHARRAAATTVSWHHRVLLEPMEAVARAAAAIRKVTMHLAT